MLFKNIIDMRCMSDSDLYNYIRTLESSIEANKANLRDQLAMAALTGILANPINTVGDIALYCESAYDTADEMLKARGE